MVEVTAPLSPAFDAGLYVPRPEQERVVRAAARGANVLVLGEPGSGKTSLLHFAAGELRAQGATVALVDAGGGAADATEVLALAAFELAGELPDSDRRAALSAALAAPIRAADPGVRAFELLRGLRTALPAAGGPLVVMLDGISPATGSTLFGRLRDQLWALPVRWVVTGAPRDRDRLLAPPADAFFDEVVELRPLPADVRLELLRRRAPEVDGLDALAAAAGQPRGLVSLVRDARAQPGGAAELAARRADRMARAAAIGDSAVRLLAELEHRPASASDAALLERLGWTRGRAWQVLQQLDAAGLVEPVDAGRRKVYRVAR